MFATEVYLLNIYVRMGGGRSDTPEKQVQEMLPLPAW